MQGTHPRRLDSQLRLQPAFDDVQARPGQRTLQVGVVSTAGPRTTDRQVDVRRDQRQPVQEAGSRDEDTLNSHPQTKLQIRPSWTSRPQLRPAHDRRYERQGGGVLPLLAAQEQPGDTTSSSRRSSKRSKAPSTITLSRNEKPSAVVDRRSSRRSPSRARRRLRSRPSPSWTRPTRKRHRSPPTSVGSTRFPTSPCTPKR